MPGQRRYHSLYKLYLRKIDGIILVYSISNRKSFENISEEWIPFLDEYYDLKNHPMILIGNKKDLFSIGEVKTQEALELTKDYKFRFFECSAKDNIGINEAFKEIVTDALEKKKIFEEEEKIIPHKRFQLTDKEKEIQKKLRFDPVANCAFSFGTAYAKVLEEKRREKELRRKNRKCLIW